MLQNKLGDTITKYLTFEIRRCVNTTENNNWCHEDEEIDVYLRKASIELWTIEKRVDMSKYFQMPLYMIMQVHEKKLLSDANIQESAILLDKVNVDSINSWFNVDGDPTYSDQYYNIGSIVDRREQWMEETSHILTRTNFYLNSLQKKHSR